MKSELIVDSFAGGGASLGIAWAPGRAPDIAINHDEAALAMHEANYPSTKHVREDVWKARLAELTRGKKVGCFGLALTAGILPIKGRPTSEKGDSIVGLDRLPLSQANQATCNHPRERS